MNSTIFNSGLFRKETFIASLTINQSGTEGNNTNLYGNETLISSLNSSSSQLQLGFSISEKYVIGSIYALFSLLGFVLNLLTIFIVRLGNNIGKEFKIQLINLAIADIAFALVAPVEIAIYLLNLSFPNSTILCKIFCFGSGITYFTSLLCSAAISLERFVIIYFPFRASRYRKRHKLFVIAAVWILGAVDGIIGLVFADVYQIRNSLYCHDLLVSAAIDTALRTFMFFTPAFVIASVYTLVFIKLCFQKSNDNKRNVSNQWKKNLDQVATIYFGP